MVAHVRTALLVPFVASIFGLLITSTLSYERRATARYTDSANFFLSFLTLTPLLGTSVFSSTLLRAAQISKASSLG